MVHPGCLQSKKTKRYFHPVERQVLFTGCVERHHATFILWNVTSRIARNNHARLRAGRKDTSRCVYDARLNTMRVLAIKIVLQPFSRWYRFEINNVSNPSFFKEARTSQKDGFLLFQEGNTEVRGANKESGERREDFLTLETDGYVIAKLRDMHSLRACLRAYVLHLFISSYLCLRLCVSCPHTQTHETSQCDRSWRPGLGLHVTLL